MTLRESVSQYLLRIPRMSRNTGLLFQLVSTGLANGYYRTLSTLVGILRKGLVSSGLADIPVVGKLFFRLTCLSILAGEKFLQSFGK
jgi:hypothetical protein